MTFRRKTPLKSGLTIPFGDCAYAEAAQSSKTKQQIDFIQSGFGVLKTYSKQRAKQKGVPKIETP
ncbi:MAG: hypothetical protein HY22_09055 [[Candidatus Thermochlorobacteriaceae] bacterium GBChlB]|nr:MAG: hypothetical protein HY22_09055 [[Candidatus Thermochlorobacteriaceae] bacterium GBChlB]